jgi:hypothetical protein
MINQRQTHWAESRFQFFPICGRDVALTWYDVRQRLAAGTPAGWRWVAG